MWVKSNMLSRHLMKEEECKVAQLVACVLLHQALGVDLLLLQNVCRFVRQSEIRVKIFKRRITVTRNDKTEHMKARGQLRLNGFSKSPIRRICSLPLSKPSISMRNCVLSRLLDSCSPSDLRCKHKVTQLNAFETR